MNLLQIKILFVIFVLSALHFGCRKSERDNDTETLAVQENALANHLFDDAFREVHRFAMRDSLLNDTGITQWFNSCIVDATLSDTVAIFPLVLTINYGDQGTLCDDGFQRYGIIRATFSGKYLNKNTIVEISFENYKKDDFSIEDGLITIQNLGLNSDAHMHYLWTVENGRITSINTDISWQCTHSMRWVAGRAFDSQGNVEDDLFMIDGISDGRSTRGNTFSNEITQEFACDFSCQWFTEGRAVVEIPNLISRTINYGDGECDNILVMRRVDTYFDVTIPY